ncbi:MAG: nucleotidyltransferase domain-containing protein [Nanoarchaeota archaeon]|nr:nucleotidyltransferase domain-containing protein [Nanoarchaeota archaeon]
MVKKKSVGKKLKNFSFETRLKSTNVFKDKMLGMFKSYIKAVIMFGSITRGEQHGKSDVDVYMIFDDTKMPLDKFEAIREKISNDMFKIAKTIDPRLHPQPVIALTEFWDGMRNSSPLFYTIVRDGYAVYDAGFFIPMRKLLEWGKFPATKEAVYKRMESVPKRIARVKNVKKMMVAEDIFYAMLDSAQALLMYVGAGSPAPGQAAGELRKHFVNQGLLDEKYAKMIEDAHVFRKKIEYKEHVDDVTGKDLDVWIENAEDYVNKMEELLKKLESAKKSEDIKRNYEIMLKASVAALKSINKLPEDPKKLPKAFREELIEGRKMNPTYADIFESIIVMRKKLDKNDIENIHEKDVYLNKEYVRRFVMELRRIIQQPNLHSIEEGAEKKIKEAKKKLETAKEIKKLPPKNEIKTKKTTKK